MTPPAAATISSDMRFEQADVTRPKRSEIEKAIIAETRPMYRVPVTRREARKLLNLLIKAAGVVRTSGYGVYQLTDADLNQYHWLLDEVLPDDISIPEPGSAHELIQRYILRGNEISLVHTRDGADHCIVAISIDSV